jgi:hypothetical protein
VVTEVEVMTFLAAVVAIFIVGSFVFAEEGVPPPVAPSDLQVIPSGEFLIGTGPSSSTPPKVEIWVHAPWIREALKGRIVDKDDVENDAEDKDRRADKWSPRNAKKSASTEQTSNQYGSGHVDPRGGSEGKPGPVTLINGIILAIITGAAGFFIAGVINHADLTIGEWTLTRDGSLELGYVLTNAGRVRANVLTSHVGYFLEREEGLPAVFDYSQYPEIRMSKIVTAGEKRALHIDIKEYTKSLHWIRNKEKTLYAFVYVAYRDGFLWRETIISFVGFDPDTGRFYPVNKPGYDGSK